MRIEKSRIAVMAAGLSFAAMASGNLYAQSRDSIFFGARSAAPASGLPARNELDDRMRAVIGHGSGLPGPGSGTSTLAQGRASVSTDTGAQLTKGSERQGPGRQGSTAARQLGIVSNSLAMRRSAAYVAFTTPIEWQRP